MTPPAPATDYEVLLADCADMKAFQSLVARISKEPEALKAKLKPLCMTKRQWLRDEQAKTEQAATDAAWPEEDEKNDGDYVDPGPPEPGSEG